MYFSYLVYRICFVLYISVSFADEKNKCLCSFPNIDDGDDGDGDDGSDYVDDGDHVGHVDDYDGVGEYVEN